MRNDRADVARILREQRIEAASARCRCPRARVRVCSFPWSKPPDRTALELLVRLCATEIQSRCATNGRQIPDRAASTSFRQGEGSARQNACVSRPQLTRPHGDALRLPAFLRESRVSRRDRRTRRRSDAKLSNPNSIPCDDRDRVHLDLDACCLFEAVLPRNNSCCFPDYVQCC